MKKIIFSLVFIFFLFNSPVFAISINDATANGSFAVEWHSTTPQPGNPTEEASFINGNVTTGGSFEYVAKYDNDDGFSSDSQTGWDLIVSGNSSANGYDFEYSLTAPSSYLGTEVDFALGVKQGDGFVAYIFKGATLNICGFFNSYKPQNGDFTSSDDYSHVSAFIVETSPVPEPSTLVLLGAGITGLALYRRKKK